MVRLSSLVSEFHTAFKGIQKGNHSALAKLAPTSILFGVWDSRGTQVKLPRIIKAEIRATNVEKLTKSAVFTPAAVYVEAEAVDGKLGNDESEKNPLSSEGMLHALASRTAGGVRVHGEIKRVVRINLVALRELRAFKDEKFDQDETDKLQKYVLGLALVVATQPLQLNLREGCLLCGIKDDSKKSSLKLVMSDGDEPDFDVNQTSAETFAEAAAKAFFGDGYKKKDVLDAKFESGVANEFLSLAKKARDQISRSGPITADAIRRFKEKGKDPLKLVSDAIKEAKASLPPKLRGKNATPVVQPEAFKTISERLNELVLDEQIDQSVRDVAGTLREVITADVDSYATFKSLETKIKEFNAQRKEGGAATESSDTSDTESA